MVLVKQLKLKSDSPPVLAPHSLVGAEARRAADAAAQPAERVVRLWAFGNEAVRLRVREQVDSWDESLDWFVA